MTIQVYFTYKPYKNGFEFDMFESDFCYINMLNASDEEIIKYNSNLNKDKSRADKATLFIIDKLSFEDHKVKVVYILKHPIDYYICFRAYLQDACTIRDNLYVKNMSFDELIDVALEDQDRDYIPFHLLE